MPRDALISPSQISGLSEPTLFMVILTTFASNPGRVHLDVCISNLPNG